MSLTSSISPERRKNLAYSSGIVVFLLLIGVGVFARNGWFPTTDGLSGKRTGWFGKEIAKNASSSWNPVGGGATPTPQLSKEYVYAGSRLLAVEDANASAVPPADLAVWRPSDGTWYVLGGTGSQQTQYQFGVNGDLPVAGDFDGDGKTDFSIFRPSTGTWWVTRSSNSSSYSVQFGAACSSPYTDCDIAAPADYDGDGKTDLAVWRPTNGIWYIVPSSTGTTIYPQFGSSGDKPAAADFDGDGKSDLTVWRSSNNTFYSVLSSNNASSGATVGSSSGTPVSGDYDGDGKANYALLQGNNWIVMNASLTATTTTSWQTSGDISVQNDYDGDGKVDIASCHLDSSKNQLYWNIKQSSGGTRTEQWGVGGDIPVPAYYRR